MEKNEEKNDKEGEKQNNEEVELDEEEEEEKELNKENEDKNGEKEEKNSEKKEKIDNNGEKNEEISDKNKNEKENEKNNENKVKEELNINVGKINDKKGGEDNNNEKEEEEEEEEKEEEDKKSTTTYILKYIRKDDEPRESAYDKELIKSKHCFFMIEFKILTGKKDKYLLIYCHEIAAIYFDEIYEKKYSIKDLYSENRHFKIFDDVVEAKNIIDEILKNNTKNSQKIYIELQDDFFKLHIQITFFDKEQDVIFNIPKKKITDKERIRILPNFLKEIQIKINRLEEDNKKLKNGSKNLGDNYIFSGRGKSNSIGVGENDFLGTRNNNNIINTKKNRSNTKEYKKNN